MWQCLCRRYTIYADYGSVYAVLSFATFSREEDNNGPFTLEHIAFEATVNESSITFTLSAEHLTRLQERVAFFSIAVTDSGEY